MGRGKVAMEFLGNEKKRMLTFNNRKKSMFKKAYELSVLCDVDVCLIINGLLTANKRNNQSAIWPEDSEKVRRIITKFQAINPTARRKKTSSQSSFFTERRGKSNVKMPFPVWDRRLDSFSVEQTFKLLEDLDQKLKMVDKRMDELQTPVDDQLPITDSSCGEEQIINEQIIGSPPDEFFNEYPTNWINQNFENDFPQSNEKLLHLPVEPMPESYIILPDPYIGLPPLNNDPLPIIDSYSGQEQIINESFSVFGSPPDQFTDDYPLNFHLNNEQLVDISMDPIPENYIILPDPYIGWPPLYDYSTPATAPSQSCWLPPLPPSLTPSNPFLGSPAMTWSGFSDSDHDCLTNDKEEARFKTLEDIANFLFA